jgi:hypothetical protein
MGSGPGRGLPALGRAVSLLVRADAHLVQGVAAEAREGRDLVAQARGRLEVLAGDRGGHPGFEVLDRGHGR